MKKRLLFAVLLSFSTLINAQGVELGCNTSKKLLFPQQSLSSNKQDLEVISDESEISNGTYLLSGSVALTSNDYYLAADEVKIKQSEKTSKAIGNVKFQTHNFMLTGSKALLKKIKGQTHTLLEDVDFHYLASNIRGSAEKLIDNTEQQILKNASYSTCPIGNNDWKINAKSILIDKANNKGVAKNVKLEFFGVPIFYTPHYEWRLEGRTSGFLAPSFSSMGGNDYQIKIPYYFNISPNQDFLLALNQSTKRGSILEGRYRHLLAKNNLWEKSYFEIDGIFLDNDKLNKDKRWSLDSQLNIVFNDKVNFDLNIDRVSDTAFFTNITQNKTSDSALNSNVLLAYHDIKNSLRAGIYAENEQLINTGVAGYTRNPELYVYKTVKGLGGRTIDLSVVNSSFKHSSASKTTGTRTHAQMDFNRTIKTSAYSLRPSLNLSTTHYALDGQKNHRRSIAGFRLDSEFYFERDTALFGKNTLQTLTPKISYHYTPKKNQVFLPNFDSAEKTINYANLFSGRKFTGIDKINNANNITLGLESEFINQDSGESYLNLKIAQTHHFISNEIDINGNAVDLRKSSNIILSTDFSLDKFKFKNTAEYNSKTRKTDRHDSSINYHINQRQFVTLAHHKDQDSRSLELYVAYPLMNKWHAFAGVNKTLGSNRITNKETTGIAYESCCYALRLAHFKTHTGNGNYDNTTSFELVLKGLATTSPGLSERLERDIPNYLVDFNN
jgi:LPS-assembly protein